MRGFSVGWAFAAGLMLALCAAMFANSAHAQSSGWGTGNAAPDPAPSAESTPAATENAPATPRANPAPSPSPAAQPPLAAGEKGAVFDARPTDAMRPPQAVQQATGDRLLVGVKSYGRVGVVSTTGFEPAPPLNIVAHGPRWQQGPYQELSVWAKENPEHPEAGALPWRFEFTLAFNEKLFHYTGEWDIGAAIRNLFVEARPEAGLDVWIGSRMYRGQDVYLFDWWPVRDLNTVGAGVGYNFSGSEDFGADDTRLMLHLGFNRLVNDPFIFETVDLPHPSKPGTRTAIYLDRQKFVASLTGQHKFGESFSLDIHTELHALPGADWINPSDSLVYPLPAEAGAVFGALASFLVPTTDSADTSIHVFARLGLGAAAYNILGIPEDRDTDRGLGNALEIVTGVSAAIELGIMGVHAAAALRRFQDADQQTDFDLDDRTELSLAVRPEFYLGNVGRIGLEISWQRFVSDGIFAASGRNEAADEWQFTVFGALSAANDGLFARPQVRLFVTLAVLTDPAREWLGKYVTYEKPRSTTLLIGAQAEWWFG